MLDNVKIKKQSFLKGALILGVANILVKLIGALFKIPLTRFILGAKGIGIYNTSYTIYNALFVIATAGLPVAISKMISEANAKNNYAELQKTYKAAYRLLLVIGIICSMALLFGASLFADFIEAPLATKAILAMAPSLFFVSIMSVYRGLFQGMSNMVPTAVSETIEAVCKLVVGLALAAVLMPYGEDFSAAGAIVGVSTGTFFAACFLMFYYRKTSVLIVDRIKEQNSVALSSYKQLYARLIKLAVPITIGASVFTLASVIDLTMIMKQLAGLGFDETQRSTMYGYYSGYAVTMFNLPPTVITSLSISIVPVIASAMISNKIKTARQSAETALRITFLFALPCAIGMSVLSHPILELVYNDANAAPLLEVLSYGIIFVSIVMVGNAIIQAYGKPWLPVINMCVGGLVKIITNFILVGNININIYGAPYGTVFCYLVTATLDLIVIHKLLKPNYGFWFVLKSILSVILMGISVAFIYELLLPYSYQLALFSAILVGIIVYFALIIILKVIKKQDVEVMPGGDKLQKLLGNFIK